LTGGICPIKLNPYPERIPIIPMSAVSGNKAEGLSAKAAIPF
jgi:hypothetical protein